MRSVFGSFHQASTSKFHHAAAGSQCTTNCVIAVILASIKRPDVWIPKDIDNILEQGDKLHLDILRETGWPYERTDSKLDIDELPDVISVNVNGMVTTASVGLKDEASYGLSSDINAVVLTALKRKPSHSFLIRMYDKCRALLPDFNGQYSLFDPHAINAHGETDPNGFACVLHFSEVCDMLEYLKKDVIGKRDEQIDLSPIDIELLNVEDGSLCENLSDTVNTHSLENREREETSPLSGLNKSELGKFQIVVFSTPSYCCTLRKGKLSNILIFFLKREDFMFRRGCKNLYRIKTLKVALLSL